MKQAKTGGRLSTEDAENGQKIRDTARLIDDGRLPKSFALRSGISVEMVTQEKIEVKPKDSFSMEFGGKHKMPHIHVEAS